MHQKNHHNWRYEVFSQTDTRSFVLVNFFGSENWAGSFLKRCISWSQQGGTAAISNLTPILMSHVRISQRGVTRQPRAVHENRKLVQNNLVVFCIFVSWTSLLISVTSTCGRFHEELIILLTFLWHPDVFSRPCSCGRTVSMNLTCFLQLIKMILFLNK